jgi:thiamine-monophosphate kinase
MSQPEFEIIARYFNQASLGFSKAGVDLGIGDDCALLTAPPGQQITISMDLLNQSVHFPVDADPALLAIRALSVNLSDLAAMGSVPLCFTLGLSLNNPDSAWLQAFSSGLTKIATRYNCPLVGGDLCKGPLSIAIQVQGTVPEGEALTRAGARIGDAIYVTGTLGDGAIALASLGIESESMQKISLCATGQTEQCRQYFKAAFYAPVPRLEIAQQARHLINSAIDISDGLLGDLGHIIECSGVGAEVHTYQLPYSDAAQCCTTEQERQHAALTGGDDYELCLTIAPENCASFERLAELADTRVTRIGAITDSPGILCLDQHSKNLIMQDQSYSHFKAKGA